MIAEAAVKTAVPAHTASAPGEAKPPEPADTSPVAGETKPPEPAEQTARSGPAAFPDDTTRRPDERSQPGTKAEVSKPGKLVEVAEPATTHQNQPLKKDVKLRFSFRYQPWEDVLKWFAEQADLSLELPEVPKGTFNYTDDRDYTPAQAIDVLNSVLLTKGYTLIRKQRLLMLVNTENPIPPEFIDTISVEELDDRGEYELVTVRFELEKLTPEELEPEIRKMIGPHGSVVAQSKARQLLVTETGGRLRAIRRTIRRCEDPEGRDSHEIRTFEVQHADPVEALAKLREFLDIPPEQSTSQDGSIKIILDLSGKKLLATGSQEKLVRVAEILKTIDVEGSAREKPGFAETPQLEVYSVAPADPESALQVITTMLAGSPDVRLAKDPKTGNLVALARPSEHATIKATLDQMRPDPPKIEVIQLSTVDPQLAVLAINKLFGGGGENPDPNRPQVDADPATKQLIIRATEAQIAQIRVLLEKMGESDTEGGVASARGGNVRTVPLTGRAAQIALEQAQQIWPTMHRNRIRVVTPSQPIPTIRPSSPEDDRPAGGTGDVPLDLLQSLFGPSPLRTGRPGAAAGPSERTPAGKPHLKMPPEQPGQVPRPPVPKTQPPASKPIAAPPAVRTAPTDKSAGLPGRPAPPRARVFFAAQIAPAGEPEPKPQEKPQEKPEAKPQPGPQAADKTPVEPKPEPSPEEPKPKPQGELSPIIVTVGSSGIMIASGDLDALDAFEDLLNTLAPMLPTMDVTIFYLKNAKAEVVAETLNEIFGSGTGGGDAGGGGLLGNIAGAALGDAGGGLLGSLLGLGGPGGAAAPTGTIQITPDPRINALVVQANAADTQKVEELLKILDREATPEEVAVAPKARMIPVVNLQADEIAEMVKQAFQDRLISGAGASGRPPSPQELIQMLRGGRRGGRGGSQGGSADIQEKMAIGVDTRNNALIVVAPDLLFQQVEQLVKQIDQAAGESKQTMRVVTLRRANPDAVQQALSALVGSDLQFGRTSTAGRAATPSTRTSTSTRGSTPTRATSPTPQGISPAAIQQLRSRMQGGFQRPGSRSRR